MYSAGPSGPTDKRSAELIGGLYLVGARGKFCAVVTERQLTLERFDGKGFRLDLAAIDRMRHLKVPILPSGTALLGIIAIYLGMTTIVAPISWLAVLLGFFCILANILSRYAILAVETGSGDRHLISGSEGNLLKLCMLVDRLRHGTPISEALVGLESLETELPTFPAYRDATGLLGKQALTAIPQILDTNPSKEDKTENSDMINFGPKEPVEITSFESQYNKNKIEEGTVPNLSPMPYEAFSEPKQNAYERAWGGREAPNWYQEKQSGRPDENRMESVLSEATQGLDMFAPGGLFDSATPKEDSAGENNNLFGGGFGFNGSEKTSRSPSSSEMIKRAHDEFGRPSEPYSSPILPPPTEEAVREECRAGVVKQARARQELRVQNLKELEVKAPKLEDYPALNRLASTMSRNRVSGSRSEKRGFSGGWLGRLLSPGTSQNRRRQSDKESANEFQIKRFQSSQHMRLRSDQDHQAEVSSMIRTIRSSSEPNTARDKLDEILGKLSNDEEEPPRLLELSTDNLRFNQLRATSSEEDPHPLPGLRRLG